MSVSHEPLGVHIGLGSNPHTGLMRCCSSCYGRGDVQRPTWGTLDTKKCFQNPDITWLPNQKVSWACDLSPPRLWPSYTVGGERMGRRTGERGALRPHQTLCHSFETEEGLAREVGEGGGSLSRTHLLEMLVWLWPEAHLLDRSPGDTSLANTSPGKQLWSGRGPQLQLT